MDTFCPYFGSEKNSRLYCEAGNVKFPDKIARRQFVYRYCADSEAWKSCLLAEMMNDFYDRDGKGE